MNVQPKQHLIQNKSRLVKSEELNEIFDLYHLISEQHRSVLENFHEKEKRQHFWSEVGYHDDGYD